MIVNWNNSLLPLELSEAYVESLRRTLPELPDDKKARFISAFGLAGYDAGVLVAERDSADFFEAVVARPDGAARDAKLAAILDLIGEGTISGKIAKDLFEIVWAEGGDPRAIVEARGLKQVTDPTAIEKLVDDIVAGNPDKVEQARAKPAMLGWFVGQVMKASGGKANPQAVNELLRAKLGI